LSISAKPSKADLEVKNARNLQITMFLFLLPWLKLTISCIVPKNEIAR